MLQKNTLFTYEHIWIMNQRYRHDMRQSACTYPVVTHFFFFGWGKNRTERCLLVKEAKEIWHWHQSRKQSTDTNASHASQLCVPSITCYKLPPISGQSPKAPDTHMMKHASVYKWTKEPEKRVNNVHLFKNTSFGIGILNLLLLFQKCVWQII